MDPIIFWVILTPILFLLSLSIIALFAWAMTAEYSPMAMFYVYLAIVNVIAFYWLMR